MGLTEQGAASRHPHSTTPEHPRGWPDRKRRSNMPDLRASTVADLAVLARHAGVHEPQAIAYLEKHTGRALGLRQAVRLLRMGRKIAGEDGIIRLAHLKQAAGVLEGPW